MCYSAKPLNTRLPSLSALRTFEAAARHLSFTRAAEELHVTQAAVSHQVRALEEELGVQLFNRLSRRVSLTEEGRVLAEAASDAFRRIHTGIKAVARVGAAGTIQVSVSPSLAVRWLVPRLESFKMAHPDTELKVSAHDRLVDPVAEGVDICIRYGSGQYSGLQTTFMMGDEVFPVCSPAYLAQHPLLSPLDLSEHVLLHDEMMKDHPQRPDWARWLKEAGVRGVDATAGYSFSHANMMLDAAAAGRGVALGRSSLVLDDLARGRLVAPFDISFTSSFAYYLAVPRGSTLRPRLQLFWEWLMAQVAESNAELQRFLTKPLH